MTCLNCGKPDHHGTCLPAPPKYITAENLIKKLQSFDEDLEVSITDPGSLVIKLHDGSYVTLLDFIG